MKCLQIRKEEIKVTFIWRLCDHIYLKNLKDSWKKGYPELINEFSKLYDTWLLKKIFFLGTSKKVKIVYKTLME